MKQYIFQFLLFFFLIVQPAAAQHFNQLDSLVDHKAKVYFSKGHQQRAATIAGHVDNGMKYYQQLLDFKPVVTLLVLSTADWKIYTTMPVVYGMPHYNPESKTLVVAAEDNTFWKSFLPPLDQLPAELSQQIQATYKNEKGNLSMQPFFDLLALHELGHAFHNQAGLTMQRKWMGELFVNICLHTYIAENEQGLLNALTLFPKMVIAGGTKEFKYTTLQQIDERYNEIGQQYPKNYGWYQCRWHFAAGVIYDAAGKQVCKKLWTALKNKKEILSDEQFAGFLETAVDKSIADMIRNWDEVKNR
jgi:hypothetical protein